MKTEWLMGLAVMVIAAGCATTPTSVPLSKYARQQSAMEGIPYYLPRPYLLITKNFAASETVTVSETSKQTENDKKGEKTSETKTVSAPATPAAGDVFSWNIIYLPDLDQKYGLRFKRGWGSQKTVVTFEEGWRLAGINSESDAQTDETIGAIGTAVKDVAAAINPMLSGAKSVNQGDEFAGLLAESLKSQVQEVRAGFWLYDIGDPRQIRIVGKWTSDEAGSSDQIRSFSNKKPKN